MKKVICASAAIALLSISGLAQAGNSPIKVELQFAQAPNVFTMGGSYHAWTENAIASLRSGVPAGTANTPAYFQPITSFTPGMLVVSDGGLASWNGQAAPGGAYAAECGSRMSLVTYIFASGDLQFDIADGIRIQRAASSWRDASDSTVSTYGTLDATIHRLRLGINWGADGLRGTADDVVLTTGTGLVNEIVLFSPQLGDVDAGAGSLQDRLDNATAKIAGFGAFQESYNVSFLGSSDSATANVSAVPEPAFFQMGALLGMSGLGCLKLRRKA